MSVKAEREKRGMTQRALADKMGTDQSTVSLWETGKTLPRAKLLPKLAEVLNCSIEDLLAPDNLAESGVKK